MCDTIILGDTMNSKILVVEDDLFLRDGLTEMLKKDGYDVVSAEDCHCAKALFKKEKPQLVILDVMLPDGNGFDLCTFFRSTDSETPILFLTSCDDEFQIVRGLDAGADDYVTKPFSPTILIKRIDAILRRTTVKNTPSDKNIITLDGLVINNEAHQVTIDNVPIELTLKEYNILQKLISSRGRVYTREQLLDDIWGYDYVGDARNVDSHVARLRSKLGTWGTNHLKTIYGIGYKIEVN